MRPRIPEFEPLRGVLADADEPLTAREVLRRLERRDGDTDAFETPHRVATVLGRSADRGAVDVIRDRPYRYRLVR